MTQPAQQPDDQSDELLEHIWARRGHILFRLQLSADYHLEREQHFSFLDRFISTVVTAAASAAVCALFGERSEAGKWLTALTGGASIAQLVFGPADMARKHARLAAEFRQVMVSALRAGEHWSTAQCDDFHARLTELEVGEPAPMAAVVLECENRAALRASEPPKVDLPWHVRLLRHWVAFDSTALMRKYRPSTALGK